MDVARSPGGRPKQYDRETAANRKREMTLRYALRDRETLDYLKQHHPKIFQKARAHADATISAERGSLPGE